MIESTQEKGEKNEKNLKKKPKFIIFGALVEFNTKKLLFFLYKMYI